MLFKYLIAISLVFSVMSEPPVEQDDLELPPEEAPAEEAMIEAEMEPMAESPALYENEYDGLEEAQVATTDSSTPLPEISLDELKSYQRLFINDFQIMLEEDGNEVIMAKYRDDIQFECDIPSRLIEPESNDWKLNGFKLGLRDSSYSIILDERAKSNNTFLNVSCYFKLVGRDDPVKLSFPPINLDAYNFEYSVSQNTYLKQKYEKQIAIFNISIIVVLALAIVVVASAWLYQVRSKHAAKYSEYILAE